MIEHACSSNKDNTEENRKNCENLILKTLNEFNTSFKSYETAYSSYKPTQEPNADGSLRYGYLNMYAKLNKIKEYVINYTENFLKNSNGTTQNSQNFYNEIIEKYNKMIESRKKLDQQLYDLYTKDYDSVYSNKKFVDSTIVTGIIWTILVTFMLYYVIVKM